ncbi:MAG: CRISPR-associated endonuclease Cas1 [Burkholderiales bacterium]|nr:CRISPR-associated endonuclease Cas1 [Burkholderiales bacterium]
MATLVLDRAQLEIRSEAEALALYEAGERRGTVPLKLVERVVIQGSRTRLDSSVLIRLAEAGATTLLLSPRTSRRVALVLGPAHNDAAVRLAQGQRVRNPAFCAQWARDLVQSKLRRQRRLLQHARLARPDARKPLSDALATLDAIDQRLSGPPPDGDDSLARLRGAEGAAARAYFAGLCTLFAPGLDFTGRNRRPPRDPVNACLSLAYTLLHFDAVRAAHVAGLDPLLGFYHRPAFGRESLASDLIEPLRPEADAWVWEMFRNRALREDHFSREKGACLMGKAGRERFYAEWEQFACAPRRWLRGRCSQLARQLRAEGEVFLVQADEEVD